MKFSTTVSLAALALAGCATTPPAQIANDTPIGVPTAEDGAFNLVFAELDTRYETALEAIPHVTLRPDPYSGRHTPVTTADQRFVQEARRLVEDVRAGRCYLETDRYPSLAEHYRLCRETKVAADKRDRKVRQLRERFGMDEAENKWEALGERMAEAEGALIEMPAPDMEALLWKLDHLFGPAIHGTENYSNSYCSAWINAVVADARRHLASGRA